MSPRQINVTIDRIISDDPTLDHATLMRALRAAIQSHLQDNATLGTPGARASAQVRAEPNAQPLPEQIAQATLRGLNR
ncbi:hypothetical protein [Sulfitobacter sp. JB4-11]|uniref:hypothetical protein n=1 Tax=Sulfitobacter rhodophyticola TaxID=3238304 RepID=UPI0035187BF6